MQSADDSASLNQSAHFWIKATPWFIFKLNIKALQRPFEVYAFWSYTINSTAKSNYWAWIWKNIFLNFTKDLITFSTTFWTSCKLMTIAPSRTSFLCSVAIVFNSSGKVGKRQISFTKFLINIWPIKQLQLEAYILLGYKDPKSSGCNMINSGKDRRI